MTKNNMNSFFKSNCRFQRHLLSMNYCSRSLSLSFSSIKVSSFHSVSPLNSRGMSNYSVLSSKQTLPLSTLSLTEKIGEFPLLNLFGMKFFFDKKLFKLQETEIYTPKLLLTIGFTILESFKSQTEKGYIPSNFKNNPMFGLIKQHLIDKGFKTNSNEFGSSINTYSLWFNFLLTNLIYLITKSLKLSREVVFDDAGLDILSDLENLRDSLIAVLDPYLRVQMQKKGITITQNAYVGFDTEYDLIDQQKCLNKLVSVQLAVQTRTYIKLPRYKTYDISYAHPLTSEITPYFKPKIRD